MYSETMWIYHRKVKLNAEPWEILVEESCKHSRRRARWCRDKISPFQNHKEITILAQVSSLVYTIETAQKVWFPLKKSASVFDICIEKCDTVQVYRSLPNGRHLISSQHPTFVPKFFGARINLALARASLIKSVICCLLVARLVQAWFATDVLPGFANDVSSESLNIDIR